MINIVIPMAGRGSRFKEAGYEMPKPLIDIYGHRMIDYVIENIRPDREYKFYFLCLRDHMEKYGLEKHLRDVEPTWT